MSDDLLRQLANLIRYGTVAAVSGVRVQVQTGGILTKPLPWIAGRAGASSSWNPPTVGEQVAVLSPNGDLAAGFVLPALYSDHHDAPEGASLDTTIHVFPDGAVLIYDHAAHHLTLRLPAGGVVELVAPGGVTITGDVRITGALHASGDIRSDGDVQAGDISLTRHPHDKVEPGSGRSGAPLP